MDFLYIFHVNFKNKEPLIIVALQNLLQLLGLIDGVRCMNERVETLRITSTVIEWKDNENVM